MQGIEDIGRTGFESIHLTNHLRGWHTLLTQAIKALAEEEAPLLERIKALTERKNELMRTRLHIKGLYELMEGSPMPTEGA